MGEESEKGEWIVHRCQYNLICRLSRAVFKRYFRNYIARTRFCRSHGTDYAVEIRSFARGVKRVAMAPIGE